MVSLNKIKDENALRDVYLLIFRDVKKTHFSIDIRRQVSELRDVLKEHLVCGTFNRMAL